MFTATTRGTSFIHLLALLWYFLDGKVVLASGLAEKWNIDGPAFEYTALKFDLKYHVSTLLDRSNLAYTVYDSGLCEQGGNDITNNKYLVAHLEEVPSTRTSEGTKEFRLAFTIIPHEISNSPVFDSSNDFRRASIRFCVRFSTYTADPTQNEDAIEVNFSETIIEVKIDLKNNFNIETIAFKEQE